MEAKESRCDDATLQEEATPSSLPALLQWRSLMQASATPPSEPKSEPSLDLSRQMAGGADVEKEEVAKFLAGVPVYNYGYVRHLAKCEEVPDHNCELDLLQVNASQASLHLDGQNGVHRRRLKQGRVREWLVKMRDGISDQSIHSFCSMLPGNAKCTAEGHPSKGGIPMVVVTGTEDELEEQLRRHQGMSDFVEPDIPMNAIPELRSEEKEDKARHYSEEEEEVEDSGKPTKMMKKVVAAEKKLMKKMMKQMMEKLSDKDGVEDSANKKIKKGMKKIMKQMIEKLSDEEAGNTTNSSKSGAQKKQKLGKPSSWGLDRIDDRYGLDHSYGIGPEGGKGVHIYVADTGIRTTHHDFHGRALPTLEIKKGIIRECDASNNKCAQDENGHGTHAAATAGGKRFGVAKASTLHSVKILSDAGHGKMSYLIQALDWVATKGLRPAIFAASVGGPGNPPSVVKAIEAASAAGVTIVVAAGNFGRDACGFTPAHVKAAISVGATEDAEDTIAPYSNFGKCVDLFAPGTDIHSAGRMSDTAKAKMTGTSMAAPHVAGAAALLLGEDNTRTPEEISLLLKAKATQGILHGGPIGAGNSPSMFLFTAPLEEGDEIWWQEVWLGSWWKLFYWSGWADLLRPGPMKELMAEAFVCCIFLITLAFMLTRCVRVLGLPPGVHEKE